MTAVPILARLAWRLSVRGGAATHWRRLVVPAASALAVAVALAAQSLLALSGHLTEREATSRSATVVSNRATAAMAVLPSSYEIAGREVFLAWVEPLRSLARLGIPPVDRLAAGEAAVSPALDRILTAQRVSGVFARRRILPSRLLREPDELVGFVRPGRPGAIRDMPNALLFAANGNGARISLFPQSRTELRPGRDLYAGLALFGLVPLVLLSWLAATAGSARRGERSLALAWIGASRKTIAFLAAAETLTLAVSGIAVSAVVVSAVTRRLDAIPIVGRRVFRGDLAVSPARTVATAIIVGATLALASGIAGARARKLDGGPRPQVVPRWGRPLRIGARIAAFAAAAAGVGTYFFLPSVAVDSAAVLAVAGILLLFAVPGLCIPVLALIARVLTRTGNALCLLAGRQLARLGQRDVRPFAVGGVVIAAVVALTGLYARTSDPIVQRSPAPQVALLRWNGAAVGDSARLQRHLRTATVIPATPMQPYGIAIAAHCEQLATVIADLRCKANSSAELARQLALPPDGVRFVNRITASPDSSVAREATVLVVSNQPREDLAQRIYAGAFAAGLPRPLVDVVSWNPPSLSLMIRWLLLGALGSGLAVAVALMIAQADTVSVQAVESRTLRRLGMTRARLRQLLIVRHALLAGCCNVVGLFAGFIVAFALTRGSDYTFQTPWAAYGAELVLSVCLVAGGAALAWIAAHQASAGSE